MSDANNHDALWADIEDDEGLEDQDYLHSEIDDNQIDELFKKEDTFAFPPNNDDGGRKNFSSSQTASKSQIKAGKYVATQGDCINNIAYRSGFHPETIWNHPQNKILKKKRKNLNTLKEGDIIFIPIIKERLETRSTDQQHTFKLKGVPVALTIRVFDIEAKPRVGVPYRIDIDGTTDNGASDDKGKIIYSILPDTVNAKLILDPDNDPEEYDLSLGAIDPLDEVTGMQSRLQNLGYLFEVSGEIDDDTSRALLQFQKDFDLKETGEIDDATKSKIEQFHDLE